MHKEHHTVKDVQEAIAELEYRQKTTTHQSAPEEEKMIKEIAQLKASLPRAKKFSQIKPKTDELYTEKKKVLEEVKKIRKVVDAKNVEIEEIRDQLEKAKESQQDVRGEADKVTVDIDALSEELSKLFETKDQRREEYWKLRYDYEIQREEINHIEWMLRQKYRVINAQMYKDERAAEMEEMIKNLPHPFEKEIGVCEHLIGHCNALKRQMGLTKESEEVARDVQSNILGDAIRAKISQKLEEGKIEEAVNKKEREAALTIGGGGGKKKNQKKRERQKAQDVIHTDELNMDINVVTKFAKIQVSPPVKAEDLDGKIAEIEKQKLAYIEKGADKLEEQKEELRKEHTEVDEEEKEDQADEGVAFDGGRGRGGRGGRGRGGRDADRGDGRGRGGRGGRGRGGREFRIRSEFEGDSDDEAYSTPAPKQQPKRKQKAEDLQIDDDNYPTL
jgi:hypothetical protein